MWELSLQHPKIVLMRFSFPGVDWYRVAEGCVLSAGEVYGVDTFAGSVVILIGLSLYSPALSLASFLGGAIGTVSAVYFSALSRCGAFRLS